MSFFQKVTTFTWNQADAAGTNYDITLGFQPSGVVLIIMGATSETDAISSGLNQGSGLGFGVSDTDRRGVAYVAVDAIGTSNILIRQSDAAILSFPSNTGADNGSLDVATVASWPSDGIRFTVDTQLAAGSENYRLMVLAVGGSDLTAFKSIQFQEPGATGIQNITSVGFQPTGVLFASLGLGTAPASGSAAEGQFMIGAADGSGNQWVMLSASDDNAATMDTCAYGLSGECIALLPAPFVRTLSARANFVGMTSTGFDLNWLSRAATRYVFALAWQGGLFHVDNALTQTDTNAFTDTSYGVTPTAALCASVCRAQSVAGTATDHAAMSLGIATGPTERESMAVMDEHGPSTSDIQIAVEYDEVYINIDPTTNVVVGLMDVVSFDANGVTLAMDLADPTPAFVGVAVWGAVSNVESGAIVFNRNVG